MTVSDVGPASGGTGALETLAGRENRHKLRDTLHRNRTALICLFCVACSAFFLLVPILPRTYELSATQQVTMQPFAPLPELNRLVDDTRKDFAAQQPGTSFAMNVDADQGARRTITYSAKGSNRDAAWVQIHRTAEEFATVTRHRSEESLANYRSGLEKSGNKLAEREQGLVRDMETFRISHRGALPDDPNSIVTQFEKLTGTLDDRQQRLRVVTEQITRLTDYKKGKSTDLIAPSTPSPIPAPGQAAAPPAKGEDPEILTLTAQLQLINDQLDEQLNTMRRTEQHPYVSDLRSKQAAIQKKLESATQRAAAGGAPPLEIRLPIPVRTPDAGASQTVDLQIENLKAEHDALDVQVKGLIGQRDVMLKQIDEIMPIRQEYQNMTDQLASIRKERQTLRSKLEEFDRQFKPPGEGEPSIAALDFSPVAMTSSSTLPAHPRLWLVYGGAIAAALLFALGVALVLHQTDRALHTPADVTAALDIPILGAVSEIHTPAQRHYLHLWRLAGYPVLLVLAICILIASGAVSFRHMENPHFARTVQQDGMLSLIYARNVE